MLAPSLVVREGPHASEGDELLIILIISKIGVISNIGSNLMKVKKRAKWIMTRLITIDKEEQRLSKELEEIQNKCDHNNRTRVGKTDVTECPDCGFVDFD